MTNPYVKQSQAKNFTLSTPERSFRKSVFDTFLKRQKGDPCVSDDINKLGNNFEDLKKVAGKLDLAVLFNLAAADLLKFSPGQLNPEIPGQINSPDGEETNSPSFKLSSLDLGFLSRLRGVDVENVDNRSTPSKSFDFDIDLPNIDFDFFKAFREGLRIAFEKIVVETIKGILKETVKFIDCNKINRCTVPEESDKNPFRNEFSKIVLKTGTDVTIFLQKKIIDLDLDITKKELEDFIANSISQIPPDQMECLLSGIFLKDLLDLLIELFKDIYGGSDHEEKIIQIFDDIDQVVDIIPGISELAPYNPCGDLHIERLRRIQLKKAGKTDQEIEQIIADTLVEFRGRISNLISSLDQLPTDISEMISVPNSDMTTAMFERSVNVIFDSLGKHYQSSIKTILSQILINPMGEACVAAVHLSVPNDAALSIPEQVKDIIDRQLLPPVQINQLPSSPLDFILASATSNFHDKYLKNFIKIESSFNVQYSVEDQINILIDGNPLVFDKNQISYEENIFYPKYSEIIAPFVGINTRKQAFDLQVNQNNSSVFFNLYSGQFGILDYMFNLLYNKFYEFMKIDIYRNFYFGEFNSEFGNQEKLLFSGKDFLALQEEKQIVLDKLNGNS